MALGPIKEIMTRKKGIIKNTMGIHVRPSGLIFKESLSYSGKIILHAKGLHMEFNSIMDLLALGLVEGDEIEIDVSGPEEEIFSQKLIDLFEFQFDFAPEE